MKVTKQCPIVLLVNVGCRQVGTLEIEEAEVMGCGLSWVRSRRNKLRFRRIWGLKLQACMGRAALWLNLCKDGRNVLGWNFDVDIGRAA